MTKTPGMHFLVQNQLMLDENHLDLLDPPKIMLMLLNVVLPKEAGEEAPAQ
jgi:hypothetical protein